MRFCVFLMAFIFFGVSDASFAQENQSTSSGAATDVNVVNTPNVKVQGKVQLEDDGSSELPQVTEPELEGLPDVMSFFNSALEWRNSFKVYLLPAHESICPTSSIALFGRSIRLDAHCTVFSDVSALLSSACIMFYTMFAIVITLRA